MSGKLKKVLSITLAIVFLLTGAPIFEYGGFKICETVYAAPDSGLPEGSWVQFGKYNGQPIVWRVINRNQDGSAMLFSEKILTYKAFDAAELLPAASYQTNYGSNYWDTANIREWLNSDQETVKYTKHPPDKAYVEGGYNNYEKEPGFLYNFTGEEREVIKEVTHKSLIDIGNTGIIGVPGASVDVGKLHKYNTGIGNIVQNFDIAYSKDLSEKVFLLDVKELHDYVYAQGYDYGRKPTEQAVEKSEHAGADVDGYSDYWLRSPYTGDQGSVRVVHSSGIVYRDDAYDGKIGVVPALNIKEGTRAFSGAGTADDPYIIGASEGVFPDRTSCSLMAGQTVQLNASVVLRDSSDKTVTWAVYETVPTQKGGDVVAISPAGLLTALGAGTAVVRATSVANSVYFADCTVKVRPGVTGISIDMPSVTLKAKETVQLTAAVEADEETDKSVVWSVYSPVPNEIGTVTPAGLVVAWHKGTMTVRATSVSNAAYYADCTVNVLYVPVNELILRNAPSKSLMPGEQHQLYADYEGPLADYQKTVTWSVYSQSVPDVVTVSNSGLVTANRPGTATVRVQSRAFPVGSESITYYKDCDIEVAGIDVTGVRIVNPPLSLSERQTWQLNAELYPEDATYKGIKWSVDRSDVAVVSDTGLLTAIRAGTVKVRASSVQNSDKYAEFTMSVTASSSNGGTTNPDPGAGSGAPAPTTAPTPDGNTVKSSHILVNSTVDASGSTAKARVEKKEIDGALEAAQADSAGIKSIKIEVEKKFVSNYEINLPAEVLSRKEYSTQIVISTEAASLILPSNLLEQETVKVGNVTVKIGRAGKAALNDEAGLKIGERPIVNVSISLDGNGSGWKNSGTPVKVSIPYKPSEEEEKELHRIVVMKVDSMGKAAVVPNGRYDAGTAAAVFEINSPGIYGTAFINTAFADLEGYDWAKIQLETLAARDIIKGTAPGRYSPSENIKRGDFLLLLVKALEVEADFEENFNDVASGDYYYQALGMAKKLGIVQGDGEGDFRPEESITRQDMFTMMARALNKVKGKNIKGTEADVAKFKDASELDYYTLESVAGLVREGYVEGAGNRLEPRENATRAETAVFVSRVLDSCR